MEHASPNIGGARWIASLHIAPALLDERGQLARRRKGNERQGGPGLEASSFMEKDAGFEKGLSGSLSKQPLCE